MNYHIHSRYSPEDSCTATMQKIVDRAVSVGLRSFGVSDHLHAKINVPALEAAKIEFEATKTDADFYFGVEVSVLREWDLEQNEKAGEKASLYGVHKGGPVDSPLAIYLPEELERRLKFEYVIGGAHWPLGAPQEQMAVIHSYHRQNMFLATHPAVDIVAHPWWWMGYWKDEKGDYPDLPWLSNFSVIPDSMHHEFAQAVIENNKIVEINASAIFLNPRYPDSFRQEYTLYLRKLKNWGVTFSLGSDAHSLETIGRTLQIADILEEIDLAPSSLWNPVNKIKLSDKKMRKNGDGIN